MSTFHGHVGDASTSEQQRWRAPITGIIIAAACTLLLAGAGNAARGESSAYSSAESEAFSAALGRTSGRTTESFTGPLAKAIQLPAQLVEPVSLENGFQSDRAPLAAGDVSFEPATPSGFSDPLAAFPNSEVVNSASSMTFSTSEIVAQEGGFLAEYREQVEGEWLNGAEIVERVALNHSINPRLLLTVIEYWSGWVTDPDRPTGDEFDFPIRSDNRAHKGLHLQLSWTANALSKGYYTWKEAVQTGNPDSSSIAGNAGTAAIDELLRELCPARDCLGDFLATYERLFGDPRVGEIELALENLIQPTLRLPFHGDSKWVLSGGPHGAWGPSEPWAAIDFAPKWNPSQQPHDKEVVAVADAVVARVNPGVVVLDLDGDGYEQTGWAILYLHVVSADGISLGDRVRQGQVIGQASNVGGVSGGDHLHIARKYNGEWIPVVGLIPLELGTWRASVGNEAYQGALYPALSMCDPGDFQISVGESVQPISFLECDASSLY